MGLSVRAWPGLPGPITLAGHRLPYCWTSGDGRRRFGNVRQLQRGLWAAAKQSKERRFHALYDRICRGDVLWAAWDRVRSNRGAAGVDRVTLAFVQEQYGVARMLGELQQDLRAGTYRPAPARRVDIPKPQGGKRPLGIPTVRDRVAQAAAKIVLEPIFEAGFHVVLVWVPAETVGHAGDGTAADRLHRGLSVCRGVRHPQLLRRDRSRSSSRRGGRAGVGPAGAQAGPLVAAGRCDGGRGRERTVAGTPQGGVISPLLANIYLHVLDTELAARGAGGAGALCR